MAEAPPVQLVCPRCRVNWPMAFEALAALATCPGCGIPTRVFAFPALTRSAAQGHSGEVAMMDGEATCFFHPQKRAQVPCDACGRFLCALCDCEVGSEHLCPACLESGARKHRIHSLEQSRVRWDQIIWVVLLVPLLLCGVIMPITSLVALGLIFWKRKAPPSLVDNTRLQLGFASAVAVLEFFASIAWLIFIIASA